MEAYNVPSERRLILYSEVTVLFISHFFIMFNMVSVKDNFTLGFVVIGIIAGYCGFFFLIIVRNLYLHYRARIWLWLAKRRFKQQRKYYQLGIGVTKFERKKKLYLKRQVFHPIYNPEP